MKTFLQSTLLLFCFFMFFGCVEKGLDTKLIASKYKNSIVKVITVDPTQQKINKSSGYLGRGSGFIVTDDGYIFTNRHVIASCVNGFITYEIKENNKNVPKYSIYYDAILNNKNLVKVNRTGHAIPLIQVFHGDNENDYTLYQAEVVSVGTGSFDGALLKIVSDINGKPIKTKFNPVPLGNSDDVTPGESLCVYGYPAQINLGSAMMLKDMSTLSVGIMSGFDYNINKEYGYIKTDAEIHPGNSGGPVFNEENKVIGIATAKGYETGIGLIGGLNAMFYVSAIDNKAHQKLIKNGLTFPKRSPSINSSKGTKYSVKSVTEINKMLEKRNNPYLKANMFFAVKSVAQNQNKIPGTSQRFKTFNIDRKLGGYIWTYIDNYPNSLGTNQIKYYIDRLSASGVYLNVKIGYKTIFGTSQFTHYSDLYKQSGSYRIRTQSKEGKPIKTEYINVKYKVGT